MGDTRTMGKAMGDAAHAAHTPDDPASEAGMSRDIINIPDNVLLDGIKDYGEKDQDDILWLFSWAGSELRSRDKLCEMLSADWTTIVRVAQGKYGAGIASFMGKVRDLRERVARSGRRQFIETPLTRKVFETLDYALAGDIEGGKIVLIVGHTRRGKTESAREWAARNNHGRSVYCDCPESGGLRALMYELARSCRVNTGRKTVDLRERLIRSFNRRRIIILDEVLRLLPSRGGHGSTQVMEFVRRLHDVTRCSIALLATPAFAQEMEQGFLRDYLEQLLGRIAEPLVIPEAVGRRECRDIACGFRSNAPQELVDLVHQVANQPGKLGVLFELLRQADALAKKKKEPLSARHLAAAVERRKKRFVWED